MAAAALVAILLAGPCGCADVELDAGGPAPGRPAASTPVGATVLAGAVSDVVDGDTIKVEARGFETPVRVIGIDTPETRHPGKPVQCHGPEASAAMEALLPEGTRVRLETDPTQDARDRYGRLLAYVYAPSATGPAGSVNHAMVEAGHARVYVYDRTPFAHAGAFRAAEERARAGGRGLWGPPCRGDTDRPAPG